MVRFDLGPLLQGQMRIVKFKSGYSSLNIGPRGLQCESNLYKIMGYKSSDVVRFDLRPLIKGQMRIAKFKSAYSLLNIGPRGCSVKTTSRTSWARNLLMWSDLALTFHCLTLVSTYSSRCTTIHESSKTKRNKK